MPDRCIFCKIELSLLDGGVVEMNGDLYHACQRCGNKLREEGYTFRDGMVRRDTDYISLLDAMKAIKAAEHRADAVAITALGSYVNVVKWATELERKNKRYEEVIDALRKELDTDDG